MQKQTKSAKYKARLLFEHTPPDSDWIFRVVVRKYPEDKPSGLMYEVRAFRKIAKAGRPQRRGALMWWKFARGTDLHQHREARSQAKAFLEWADRVRRRIYD